MGKLYLGTQEITPFVYDNQGGGTDIGIPREISQSGVYQMPSSSFTYTLPAGVTDLGDHVLYYAFYSCTGLTSADLSGLASISNASGAQSVFYRCTSLTSADLSGLTTISSESGLASAFSGCTSLTSIGGNSASVDLSNLTTVTGTRGMQSCFMNCTSLATATFPSLATINGANGSFTLSQLFRGCTNLTSVSFPVLSNITSPITLSDCFQNMLYGCSGVTVHFPAAMQSVINESDFKSAVGGTSITILYDL